MIVLEHNNNFTETNSNIKVQTYKKFEKGERYYLIIACDFYSLYYKILLLLQPSLVLWPSG